MKKKDTKAPCLPLMLVLPSSAVLVGRDRSWDVAKVKKVCWAPQASKKLTQKRVKPSGEVMRAIKDRHGCWGVRKVAKSREERLTHGGSPLTLLLAAHI